MTDDGILLSTKLYTPEPQPHMVARPHLLARLNEGLQPGRRLSLVCAPAGYGKTTLVSQWLTGMQAAHKADNEGSTFSRFAWVTLDEADNDMARFLAYLTAGLRRIDPGIEQYPPAPYASQASQASQAVLGPSPVPQASVTPPAHIRAASLVNEIAQSAEAAGPSVLVLDDYQQIQLPSIHQYVEFLVEHAPPRFHIVLITREDPPFALTRLRVRGQITEIREADLRFTLPEAASFLNDTMRVDLTEVETAALTHRTEGWIAGLQLAGLSLRGRGSNDRGSFLETFSGSNRYIIDYLMDEVLKRQPEEMRRFLCQTAILDRLCPPLCNAVTGRKDSKEVLSHLEQANIFVIPLDERREWYRYHRLFADCLVTQLHAQFEERERASLHLRAARWLEEHDLPADAARHALAAGEREHAATLINSMAPGLIARGELHGLLGWLDALPEWLVRNNLDLVMYRAWALFLTGRVREAAGALKPVRARLPAETDPEVRARILVLLSWLANFEEDTSASVQMAAEGLTLIGGEESLLRVLALDLLGEAQVRLGAGPAATVSFREGISLAERVNQPFAAIAILYNLAMELNRQGRRTEALALCTDCLRRYSDRSGRPLPVVTQICIPLAWLYYEANELEMANEYLDTYLHKGSGWPRDIDYIGLNTVLLVDGPWLQANIRLAEGDGESALAATRQAARAGREAGHTRLEYIMAACEAHIQLRLGDKEAATRWAIEAGLWGDPASRPPDPARELVDLALTELLLAAGRTGDARALLANLERSAQGGRRRGRLLRIHLLQSAAELAASSESTALSYLQRAVELAAPEGYVRAFLDEGAAVSGLLPRLPPSLRNAYPNFVGVLVQASAGVECAVPDGRTTGRGDTHNPQLDEPLSEQEMRILRLLAARMTNQEIAGELVVTVGTVKWHLHNIYGKLGAGTRAQAVARARQFGLLA